MKSRRRMKFQRKCCSWRQADALLSSFVSPQIYFRIRKFATLETACSFHPKTLLVFHIRPVCILNNITKSFLFLIFSTKSYLFCSSMSIQSVSTISKEISQMWKYFNYLKSCIVIIATGVRPQGCEWKQAKSRAVISCCVFDIC